MRAALVDLTLMLAMILIYIELTLSALPVAGWLFTPYAMWVITAGALNWEMIKLNPVVSSGS